MHRFCATPKAMGAAVTAQSPPVEPVKLSLTLVPAAVPVLAMMPLLLAALTLACAVVALPTVMGMPPVDLPLQLMAMFWLAVGPNVPPTATVTALAVVPAGTFKVGAVTVHVGVLGL